MSTTPSSSSKNSNKVTAGAPIEIVRFVGQFLIGRVLEPKSSITDGEYFRGGTIRLSYYNDVFLSLQLDNVDGKATYTQLVPWSAVATVILK